MQYWTAIRSFYQIKIIKWNPDWTTDWRNRVTQVFKWPKILRLRWYETLEYLTSNKDWRFRCSQWTTYQSTTSMWQTLRIKEKL